MSSPLESESMSPAAPSNGSTMEDLINKATKWAVTGIAAGVVLWRHDAAALWATTGAVINAANSKLLKSCINQQRPATALLKIDPGMPSSHAQSLGFLSTYAAVGIAGSIGVNPASVALCGAVFGSAAYLARLRVSKGLHTTPQVLVGAAIGSGSAVLWSCAWKAAEPYVAATPWASTAVWAAFFVAATSFAAYGVKTWKIGDP